MEIPVVGRHAIVGVAMGAVGYRGSECGLIHQGEVFFVLGHTAGLV